jgi:hypothetical protein
LILFLHYPPTNHKLQPIDAAPVSAAIAAADHVKCPHCNLCKEDNIMVAVVLAGSILVVIENLTQALTTMGPRVKSRLEMYHTNVLMYHTMVFLVRPTKVRR